MSISPSDLDDGVVSGKVRLTVLAAAGYWYAGHRAKGRWARETALPEIEPMIEEDVWRNLVQPYRLAEKAEAIIPRDPRLAELCSKRSLKIDIKTEPPGAKVYMKEYAAPEREGSTAPLLPVFSIGDVLLRSFAISGEGQPPSHLIRISLQVRTSLSSRPMAASE